MKNEFFSGAIQEKKYERPKGLDVRVRNFYFRHAEKASGEVGTVSDGISRSAISLGLEGGRMNTLKLSSQLPEPADKYHIGWSGNVRTLETMDALTLDYDGKEQISEPVLFPELLDSIRPKEWDKLYISIWEGNKSKIMQEKSIDPAKFSKLSPSQQAEIAEGAEEPVMNEWIDNPESELAKLYPVETAATHIAVLVKQDLDLTAKLDSGTKLDQFRGTHKTITEPLLMKIIILENGKKPQKLEDIGGCMDLNDGWELDVRTDDKGEITYKFIMYRAVHDTGGGVTYLTKEFSVDVNELNRLGEIGLKLKEQIKKNNE